MQSSDGNVLVKKCRITPFGPLMETSSNSPICSIEKEDLILIHNMGKKCAYCTLWADGFNGVRQHLQDRAGFVVISPDEPATIKEFAASRGWRFNILSSRGSSFTKDMGFENEKGEPMPGVSAFQKNGQGKVLRVSRAGFGPGDDYCAVWHLFDLLADGSNGWRPKFSY